MFLHIQKKKVKKKAKRTWKKVRAKDQMAMLATGDSNPKRQLSIHEAIGKVQHDKFTEAHRQAKATVLRPSRKSFFTIGKKLKKDPGFLPKRYRRVS